MKRPPRSLMLERVESGTRDTRLMPILMLHDGESRPDALDALAASFERHYVVRPRAPRWAAFRGPSLFSWFNAPGDGTIDPVTYGDSLSQLELVLPTMEAGFSQGISAIGFGQGATMLAGLAALWPEKFAGIALVGGSWPDWLDPLIPHRPMSGLPTRIQAADDGVAMNAASLGSRGARVDHTSDEADAIPAWIIGTSRAQELLV